MHVQRRLATERLDGLVDSKDQVLRGVPEAGGGLTSCSLDLFQAKPGAKKQTLDDLLSRHCMSRLW